MKNTIKKTALLAVMLSSTLLMADGAATYKKCAGCHGIDASKKALGKSKVIANMKSEDIVMALKGYKDGSYGGSMKGLMKGQAVNLSDNDIKELSTYIVSLKKK